jgi:hypothetical protein
MISSLVSQKKRHHRAGIDQGIAAIKQILSEERANAG